jgi:hypothetical protein
MGEVWNVCRILLDRPLGKQPLGRLDGGEDGRIILRRKGVNGSATGLCQMASLGTGGVEPSGSATRLLLEGAL